jgi:hypothetical protein
VVVEEKDKIVKVFHELHQLLKDGKFTHTDIRFMETYLEKALESTKRLREKAEKQPWEGEL